MACSGTDSVVWNVYIKTVDISVFIQFVLVVQIVNFVLLIKHRLRVLNTFISSSEFCSESNHICDPWGVICLRMSIQNVQIFDNNMIHLDTFSRASVSDELWSYEVNSSAIRCNWWNWHHTEKLRLPI
jgi:hypothetical protein